MSRDGAMQHSELLNEAEALAYLHLAPDDTHCLKTLRTEYGLHSARLGRNTMYLRSDLDRVVERVFGRALPSSRNGGSHDGYEQTDHTNSHRASRRKKLDQQLVRPFRQEALQTPWENRPGNPA
ncbi:MAG: hypothetical protein M0Z50_15640 [Planctomycetia bacterium]|nr:hypothetical protein [Planctomycetia bacterium]